MNTPSGPSKIPLRLVSWNIQYDAWTAERRAGIHAMLTRQRPDVVCLQEVPSHDLGRAHDIAAALGLIARIAEAPHGLHTAILTPSAWEEIAWDDKYVPSTWHGFAALTVRAPDWPVPLTVISAHLVPHSVDLAVTEAQLVMTRAHRHGAPTILAGDINQPPLHGPEPDWDQVPEHTRATRTVLDPDHPGVMRADRRVGLALARGGLVDVAAHLATTRDDDTLLAPTGMGRIRVDQTHISTRLVPTLLDYQRLPLTEDAMESDHHPVMVDLDLGQLTDTTLRDWH